MNTDFIAQQLQKLQLSLTVQRKVVLNVLNEHDDHLTADQIYDEVKKALPRISVGTVYRNLGLLAKADLIDCHKTGADQALYEIKKPPHYHIICESCGKMEDLHGVHISKLEEEIAKVTGYQVNRHALDVHGVCPNCRTHTVEIEEYS